MTFASDSACRRSGSPQSNLANICITPSEAAIKSDQFAYATAVLRVPEWLAQSGKGYPKTRFSVRGPADDGESEPGLDDRAFLWFTSF